MASLSEKAKMFGEGDLIRAGAVHNRPNEVISENIIGISIERKLAF